MQATKSEVIAM